MTKEKVFTNHWPYLIKQPNNNTSLLPDRKNILEKSPTLVGVNNPIPIPPRQETIELFHVALNLEPFTNNFLLYTPSRQL